ncbi:UDP-glucuronosyltransferase 2B20-like [Melanaphis sacchari]|uniref:UDP-glucuronosyltransferase n=2 Tax=Melanaphis sacchari TaxID=742174 RepID=A0A2H8TV49_9HEMI|nr:UDP-glucuronosyltransferase 2B20-like [Melanaphis sacchari]
MCKIIILIVVLVLISSCIQQSSSARILAVETVGGKSHWNFMSGILQALVNNKHNVTVFTPFTDGNRENYTEVDTTLGGAIQFMDMDLEQMMTSMVTKTGDFVMMSRMQCDQVYKNSKMKEILSSERTDFDLLIIEFFASDCVSYIATKFNLPLIYVTPLQANPFMDRTITGHVSSPSTVTVMFSLYSISKTFIQRLTHIFLLIHFKIVKAYKELILKYSKQYDFIEPISPSLIFVNRHFITDAPSPISTNVINVGGIHLKAPQKLPEDILDFIEQSPHGVIYFTFGSTIKMSSIPKHIKKALMEAFAEIPQRVLWKYENELEKMPKNVMIKKWLPQRDILLNPNVKLFISHGGISGVYETVDAGVPVLGLPLFGDQHRNIDNLVNVGMAISMDLMSITKDNFLRNVLELFNNEKYKKNAETVSKIFKDQPMSQADSVVYWTEYVLRHKSAQHFKSRALNLRWYQYYLLDVLALIFVFISVVIFITTKVFKSICVINSLIFSKNYKSKPE